MSLSGSHDRVFKEAACPFHWFIHVTVTRATCLGVVPKPFLTQQILSHSVHVAGMPAKHIPWVLMDKTSRVVMVEACTACAVPKALLMPVQGLCCAEGMLRTRLSAVSAIAFKAVANSVTHSLVNFAHCSSSMAAPGD